MIKQSWIMPMIRADIDMHRDRWGDPSAYDASREIEWTTWSSCRMGKRRWVTRLMCIEYNSVEWQQVNRKLRVLIPHM